MTQGRNERPKRGSSRKFTSPRKQVPKDAFIFGRHPVLEGLKSARPFDKILLKKGITSLEVDEILELAKSAKVPVQRVPEEKLNRITKKNHQGVIGFTSLIRYYSVSDVLMKTYDDGETPLFVLLDGVTDVRNFGAIARTAFCMGVHAIVVPEKGSAQVNAEAMKASAGALHELQVCKVSSIAAAGQELLLNGLRLYAADLEDATPVHDIDFTAPCGIIMGAEGSGISGDLKKLVNQSIFIPMAGNFDSLNVSVATGVILYEASKQRTTAGQP